MAKFYHDLKWEYKTYKSPNPVGVRKGIFAQWVLDSGQTYYADICPLPGYSQETLDDVVINLKLLQKNKISIQDLLPSVHFAVTHPLIKDDFTMPQGYQALIYKNTLASKLPDLKKFKTLKIKIKGFTSLELIELVKSFSSTHILRFDAQGQKLDSKFLVFLLDHPESYDYVEEPYFDQDSIKLKTAIDESFFLKKTIQSQTNITAIIYKPTLVGGVERISKSMKDYRWILSSCFESSLGIKQIIKLHQTLYPHADWDIGVDTMPIEEPISYLKNRIPVLYDSSSFR